MDLDPTKKFVHREGGQLGTGVCHGGVVLYGLRAVLLHLQGIECTIGNACVMRRVGLSRSTQGSSCLFSALAVLQISDPTLDGLAYSSNLFAHHESEPAQQFVGRGCVFQSGADCLRLSRVTGLAVGDVRSGRDHKMDQVGRSERESTL